MIANTIDVYTVKKLNNRLPGGGRARPLKILYNIIGVTYGILVTLYDELFRLDLCTFPRPHSFIKAFEHDHGY